VVSDLEIEVESELETDRGKSFPTQKSSFKTVDSWIRSTHFPSASISYSDPSGCFSPPPIHGSIANRNISGKMKYCRLVLIVLKSGLDSSCRIRGLSVTSGAKQLGVVFSGRFRSAFLVFFVILWRFENVLQVVGEIDLDQDRLVNETRCPEIAWK